MLKSKLLAIIAGSTSVVVAATTALTLAVSGPRNVQSLHMLSDNEAVTAGIEELFSTASNGVDTVSNVIDTITENKAELALGLTINEMADMDEALNGIGGDFNIKFDVENEQYSIGLSAAYGSIELINAVMYMDSDELVAYVPSLFEGIVKVSYDNLAEDLENSYVGSLLAEEDFDFDEFRDEFMLIVEEATNSMPEMEYEFDYEEFTEELSDTIKASFLEAFESMDVTDNGKQPLNGGKYQCYTASVSVAELSNILKDGIMYILESEEFMDYMDYVMEYYNESLELDGLNAEDYDDYYDYDDYEYYDDYYDYDDYDDYYGYGSLAGDMSYSSMMSSMAPMIDSYWGMIVSEIEAVLGKNIEFTLYLTDAVETAGFEFYISKTESGAFNYSKEYAKTAAQSIAIKGDFTGGKEIGDYTYLSLSASNYGTKVAEAEYSFQIEENGAFSLVISASEEESSLGLFQASGTYTEDGMFFDLDIDSMKYIDEYGETVFDIGLRFSFQAIDSVDRPSASPEYDIWEMDEADFEALSEEIMSKLEQFESILN